MTLHVDEKRELLEAWTRHDEKPGDEGTSRRLIAAEKALAEKYGVPGSTVFHKALLVEKHKGISRRDSIVAACAIFENATPG